MVTPTEIKGFCKAVRECVRRGELTQQQGRTLMGQAKNGDYMGALNGLKRLYSR